MKILNSLLSKIIILVLFLLPAISFASSCPPAAEGPKHRLLGVDLTPSEFAKIDPALVEHWERNPNSTSNILIQVDARGSKKFMKILEQQSFINFIRQGGLKGDWMYAWSTQKIGSNNYILVSSDLLPLDSLHQFLSNPKFAKIFLYDKKVRSSPPQLAHLNSSDYFKFLAAFVAPNSKAQFSFGFPDNGFTVTKAEELISKHKLSVTDDTLKPGIYLLHGTLAAAIALASDPEARVEFVNPQ